MNDIILSIEGFGFFSDIKLIFENIEKETLYKFDNFGITINSLNSDFLTLIISNNLSLYYFDKNKNKYKFKYYNFKEFEIDYNKKYIFTTNESDTELIEGFIIEFRNKKEDNNILFEPNEIISYELNQPKPNLENIEELLLNEKTISDCNIQEILNYYQIFDTENKKEILNLLIKNNNTPFTKFYSKKKNDTNFNNLNYLLMVFSSYYYNSIEPRIYYSILFELEKNIKKHEVSEILVELDKLTEDYSLNSLFKIIKKQFPNSIYLLFSKNFLINEVYKSINSMKYYIQSFKYLNITLTDKLFYDYIPQIQRFSPIEDNFYFDYYIKIFYYIKNKIDKCKTYYEIYDLLLNNYGLMYEIRNSFQNKKTNKHILNIFMKDFGRIKFEEHINYLINDMGRHLINNSNSNEEITLSTIKKILNKK